MTDQTVSVPVELIKRIKDRYPANSRLESSPIKTLVGFIPAPAPEVSDTLTIEQIKALPARSVLTDVDGDVYVSDGTGAVRVTAFRDPTVRGRGGAHTIAYAPYTLLHIGKPNHGARDTL